MTISQYIKEQRQAGHFPNMPIDSAAGNFWLCDDNWKRIDDPKNWFTSRDQAQAFKSKMLEKKVKYLY